MVDACKKSNNVFSKEYNNPSDPFLITVKGSADYFGLILDWKTKDSEFDDKTKLAYPDHGMQLAAYREGLKMPNAICANVFISPSAKVRIHIWDEEELRKLWRKFTLALELWQIDRNYDSSFEVEK